MTRKTTAELAPLARNLESALETDNRQQQVAQADRFLAGFGYRPTIAMARKKRTSLGNVKF